MSQAPETGETRVARVRRWCEELHLHTALHPVTVRHHRNGQVTVSLPFPSTPPDEGCTVTLTCTLTPDELRQLAKVPPIIFADVMSAQLAQAAYTLFPPPAPRRKSPKTLLKWEASKEAKRMYPTIQWLMKHPEYQKNWFKELYTAVERSTSVNPKASDITAWIVERLFPQVWEHYGLCKPTEHPRFTNDYLYTKPRWRAIDLYTPYELERMIRPLVGS
jgi:hypothetical protein